MIQDLHSHTYYSFCGEDTPEKVVEAAIDGGVQLLGITDHNHGIGNATTQVFFHGNDNAKYDYERTLRRYFDHIDLIKEKYAGKIEILRGIELCTKNLPRHYLPYNADISYFDYCLIENIDEPDSITNNDIFSYAERLGTVCGIAHTDMFASIKSRGEDAYAFFKRMADMGIFWEMNVNLDTIHGGREHKYMLEFFSNDEQQAIVRESGVRLSVGFDGHRVYDYKPDRIAHYCNKISEMGIKLAFEE